MDGEERAPSMRISQGGLPTTLPKKGKKRIRIEKEEEEERRLASKLFGRGRGSVIENDDDDVKHKSPPLTGNEANGPLSIPDTSENLADGALFVIDRDRDEVDESDTAIENRAKDEDTRIPFAFGDEKNEFSTLRPAWQDNDEDDDDDGPTVSLTTNARTRNLREREAETEITKAEYAQRQRSYFQSLHRPSTGWAEAALEKSTSSSLLRTTPHMDDDADDDDRMTASQLLSSSKSLLATAKSSCQEYREHRPLPPSKIDIVRRRDVNLFEKSRESATVQSVQFHPRTNYDNNNKNDGGSELLLTAGLDKKLKFFKITDDGESNEKVNSIYFTDMPVHRASFLGTSGRVVASGRRSFFYLYDAAVGKVDRIPSLVGRTGAGGGGRRRGHVDRSLETFVVSPDGRQVAFLGVDGRLTMWDPHTKTVTQNFRINGSVRCAAFHDSSTEFFASGSDGDVYRFDLRTQKCLSRTPNEDGTISSGLAYSATADLLAVGAESGVVNLYRDDEDYYSGTGVGVGVCAQPPSPTASFLNLHTAVSSLRFDPSGEILAMASSREKDAMRLVHVPTRRVFSNWPTAKTPLDYVRTLDFSSTSRFLAVGNSAGKCLLYRLKHY